MDTVAEKLCAFTGFGMTFKLCIYTNLPLSNTYLAVASH